MPGRRFSDEQRDVIAARRESGESYLRIARSFECSPSTVYWICLKLGAEAPQKRPLPKAAAGPMVVKRNGSDVRRFTPEEDARLIALEAEGKGDSEIGAALGRRANSVRGRLMTLARREAREEA